MTKHSQAAEGDRHPPVDRTFADAATRLAYSFTANDIGKWYEDEDTGIVWELTNSYLPGFSQKTAAGTALYNYPFNVITVDPNESSADYNTLAEAVAVAVSGDIISVGPGTHVCDNVSLPAGVDLVGFGIDITVLSTSGVTALNVDDGSHVSNLTCSSVNASGNAYPCNIIGDNVVLDKVKGEGQETDGGNIQAGIRVQLGSADLYDCIGVANAASGGTGYGLYIPGSGSTVNIYRGNFIGLTYDLYASDSYSSTYMYLPHLRRNKVHSDGDLYGTFLSQDGEVVLEGRANASLPSAEVGGRLLYDMTNGSLQLDTGSQFVEIT